MLEQEAVHNCLYLISVCVMNFCFCTAFVIMTQNRLKQYLAKLSL